MKAKHPQKVPAKSVCQQIKLAQQVVAGTIVTSAPENPRFIFDFSKNGILKPPCHSSVPSLVGLAVNLAIPSWVGKTSPMV
jgi:hypothetical protein